MSMLIMFRKFYFSGLAIDMEFRREQECGHIGIIEMERKINEIHQFVAVQLAAINTYMQPRTLC